MYVNCVGLWMVGKWHYFFIIDKDSFVQIYSSDSTEWQTNILICRDAPYYVVWCIWKCTWSPNYLPSCYTNTAVELAGWKGLSTPCFKENQPYFTWEAPYFRPSKLNGHRHRIENLGNKYQQMKYMWSTSLTNIYQLLLSCR